MEEKLLLIDADSLCYLGKETDTFNEIIEKVDDKIQDIVAFDNTISYYSLFVSKSAGYFRNKIGNIDTNTYKANRKYKLNYVRAIKEYLITKYKANYTHNVEADDLISFWKHNSIYIDTNDTENLYSDLTENTVLADIEIIIASIDKDVLNAIPGTHINYSKKTSKDTWEIVKVNTTIPDSNMFKLKQLVIGDTSDNIPGIKGYGEKKWEKLITNNPNIDIRTILKEYIVKYGYRLGILLFQDNYRKLNLLTTKDEWLYEVGEYPTSFTINKVVKDENENSIEYF